MSKPHSAVFLAKVPKSFKPNHALAQPDEILGGKFLARRLSIADAVKFAKSYNKTHLPCEGTYRFKWAVAIADLDRCYEPSQGNRGPRRQNQLRDSRTQASAPESAEAATEGGAT
jgi:hypothetical protein